MFFRMKLLQSCKARMSYDGINSLRYNVMNVSETRLFTFISVAINQTAVVQVWQMCSGTLSCKY